MDTLIFSDSHLTNSFDEKKWQFFKKVLTPVDRVIINGDFWDSYTTSFDKFVHSPWKDTLFPLLLKKKTVYVYGNHDAKHFSDKRVSFFSVAQHTKYTTSIGKSLFTFEHGDRLVPLVDSYIYRVLKTKPGVFLNVAFDMFEGFCVRFFRKIYLNTIYGQFNKTIKSRIKPTTGKNEFFVFGHTHLAEVDKKNRFLNSGLVRHGLGQYILIKDGDISLHETWYSESEHAS